jgi:hypothetical protein
MNLDDCYSEKKRNANGDIVARMYSVTLFIDLFLLLWLFIRQDQIPIGDEQSYRPNPRHWDESWNSESVDGQS